MELPALSCVCLADGYRRVVRINTGLDPDSEEFCNAYSQLFCQSLKKTLVILFKNGIKTLYFPLFGPSLLKRSPLFKSTVIPAIYGQIFVNPQFQEFYRSMEIQIQAYGHVERVEEIDTKNLDMKRGILNCIEESSTHPHSHTLYFGFMSSHTPTAELFPHIISFHQKSNRPPTLADLQTLYYNKPQKPIDIIISSKNPPPLRALPPYLDFDQASTYSFLTPFDLAFNEKTFKRILLHHHQHSNANTPNNDYSPQDLQQIDNLKDYYQKNRHTILTPGLTPPEDAIE